MKEFLIVLLILTLLIDCYRAFTLSMKQKGQVFVCTNRYCREKGSDATAATFQFLCPSDIPITSVNCLGRCNQGPNVRVFSSITGQFVEASKVRSVGSIVEILQDHLNLNVNITSAETLRLNYEGNILLRNGQVDEAIEFYDKALSLGDIDQEGVLLVMRGTALLQRAYACKLRHGDILSIAQEILPSYEIMTQLVSALMTSSLNQVDKDRIILQMWIKVRSIGMKLDTSPQWETLKSRWPDDREGIPLPSSSGESLLYKAAFTYSLYENSLMKSLRDLLLATVVLPGFGQGWRRAGDALAEMRRYGSAVRYYDMALKLDPSLREPLRSIMERLRMKDQLLIQAEAKGFTNDQILTLLEEV